MDAWSALARGRHRDAGDEGSLFIAREALHGPSGRGLGGCRDGDRKGQDENGQHSAHRRTLLRMKETIGRGWMGPAAGRAPIGGARPAMTWTRSVRGRGVPAATAR